ASAPGRELETDVRQQRPPGAEHFFADLELVLLAPLRQVLAHVAGSFLGWLRRVDRLLIKEAVAVPRANLTHPFDVFERPGSLNPRLHPDDEVQMSDTARLELPLVEQQAELR